MRGRHWGEKPLAARFFKIVEVLIFCFVGCRGFESCSMPFFCSTFRSWTTAFFGVSVQHCHQSVTSTLSQGHICPSGMPRHSDEPRNCIDAVILSLESRNDVYRISLAYRCANGFNKHHLRVVAERIHMSRIEISLVYLRFGLSLFACHGGGFVFVIFSVVRVRNGGYAFAAPSILGRMK